MLAFKQLNLLCYLIVTIVICKVNNIACMYGESDNVVYYPNPNDDGTFIAVNLDRPEYAPKRFGIMKDPKYYLYTKETWNGPVELFIGGGNRERIAKALQYFDPNVPLKILCHGFLSNSKNPFPQDIKDTYLKLARAPNVLLVDWGQYSGLPYYSAQSNAPTVAKRTAMLIQMLLDERLIQSFDQVHFIGHSLGAHIAGMTGTALGRWKLGRITGLDPAGPYYCGSEEDRLNPRSAKFVDVIHTDDGDPCSYFSLWKTALNRNFGNPLKLGTADFFPNGGMNQPGCSGVACGHARSYNYMQESINPKYQFVATPCESWEKFRNLKYANYACMNQPRELMGEYVSRYAHGSYYLRTGMAFPYSLV